MTRRTQATSRTPASSPIPASTARSSYDDYFRGHPLRIGTGVQLLIDDWLVEDRWELKRELYFPEKHPRNPVLICDRPWEGAVISGVTVFWDPTKARFRMWYCPYVPFGEPPEGLGRICICYAESTDGINWEKPLSGRYPVGPHRQTNVVYRSDCPGDPYAMVSQVFRDETDPDDARRYKMITYQSRPIENGEARRGVNLLVSPDGLNWALADDRPILDYNSDFPNHLTYDPTAGHWLLYCRPKVLHATGLQWKELITPCHPEGRHSSRRLAVMTSRDFKSWSYPRTCFYPDERDTPDYDALSVFRCGSHFLMLYVAMEGDGDGTKDVRLASSRDGLRWERFHSRNPLIVRGRPGDFDGGQVQRISTNPPILHGSDLFIFYTGASKGQFDWHGHGGVGLAVSTQDRFAMQSAGDEPGFLITREFILEGNRLRVNSFYRKVKSCVHYLKVEILHHPELGSHAGFKPAFDGFAFADCDTMKENDPNALVTWKGSPDLTPLMGKAIYLRFQMRNMSLFAFRTSLE